jgi:hypothetical protein
VREELYRRDKAAALDEYLDDLRVEVGEPSADDWAWAEGVVDRMEAHLRKPRG